MKKILFSIFLNLIAVLAMQGQSIRMDDLKSVFIIRFAQNITWPNEQKLDSFRIGFYQEDSLIVNRIRQLEKYTTVRNKPIKCIYLKSYDYSEIKEVQALYLNEFRTFSLSKLKKSIGVNPILVISNNSYSKSFIMINFLYDLTKSTRLSFETNKRNISANGMELDPSILLLGGTEIDLRNLYRISEDSLRKEKTKVEEQLKMIKNQELRIIEQLKDIEIQNDYIRIQKLSINDQNAILENLSIEIDNKLKDITNQSETLKTLNTEVSKKNKQLKKLINNIRKQEEIIAFQKDSIIFQKKNIKSQAEDLGIKQNIIKNQRQIIYLISFLSLVIAILLSITIRLYRNKLNLSKKFEQQNSIISNQNEELETQSRNLQQINKELESFSYSVSHDLRAPLRSIDGFSQILIEDYSGNIDTEGKAVLARIRTATNRMSGLINDLLKLSRISRHTIIEEIVDITAFSNSILKELRFSQPERKATISIEDNLMVRGDSHLLQIAISNLLENAWKFTSKNENTEISVYSDYKDSIKYIIIKDNGAGFDMQYKEKLFTAFQRLHHNSEFPGTGIGLSIVQRIINLHKGEIFAESKVNMGTSIYIKLNIHGA